MRPYIDDRGNSVDVSQIKQKLYDNAVERSYEEQEEISEEEYMKALYPYNHDEYLVNGAILTCNMATEEVKSFGGNRYQISLASDKTVLNVTENPKAKCCGDLRHATILDCKKYENIKPFRCNCKNAPHNEKEWKNLLSDNSCKALGTCKALMDLNAHWDNMPSDVSYMNFSNEQYGAVPGINMTSMLFCRHGGIITPVNSGQIARKEIVRGVSEEFIGLLKKYETGKGSDGKLLLEGSPALQPYHGDSDAANVHTIGWGHAMFEDPSYFTFSDGTIINLYPYGTTITLEQAEEILESDIAKREGTINSQLDDRKIAEKVNQQFYDALFFLMYQNGESIFIHKDFSGFLSRDNFNLDDEQQIQYQFGEYTNGLELGTMRRVADALDIIFASDYERDYDVKRYGDIWRKLSYPDEETQYPEGA